MKALKSLGFTVLLLLSANQLATAQGTTEAIQSVTAGHGGFAANAPAGFTFESANPISVSSLGILNYLFALNVHNSVNDPLTVGIWDANGTLLASTTISSTTPVMTLNDSSYITLSAPVTLFAGQFYIAAVFNADPNPDDNHTLAINAFFPGQDGDAVTLGNGLTLGSSPSANAGPGLGFAPGEYTTADGSGAAGANFLYSLGVPEPRTITLLGVALGFFAIKGVRAFARRHTVKA